MVVKQGVLVHNGNEGKVMEAYEKRKAELDKRHAEKKEKSLLKLWKQVRLLHLIFRFSTG